MTFNAKSFLKDHRIQFREYGKNWQPGWIQIICPFCGDHNYHGGFKLSTGSYNCWRCKSHTTISVISKLLRIPISEAKIKLSKYLFISRNSSKYEQDSNRIAPSFVDWPKFTTELKEPHLAYLKKRNFNPDELIKTWNIKGTGIHGDYKYRIIAPIYFNGKMVSYQGRDITGKSQMRYKACEKINEVTHHKNTLYGIDYVGKSAIIVEGITDVWRIGPGAISTFGTSYTTDQILLIASTIEHAILMYDSGINAQIQQELLAAELSSLDVKVTQLHLFDGDPAELNSNDVNYLRNKYLKN